MTLNNAAWAIDGARINARLARRASYNVLGNTEGVTSAGDLKVSTLAVPGVGLTISAGNASLLNRYQGASINETYSISNIGDEVLDSSFMPPANAAARSHLVCVTIGDPEFSQAGHPWMLSTDPAAGTEETFKYVRFFVIPNVPAGTTSFKQLNKNYPALALARIDVPANTSTITSGMITDLRKLARPRQARVLQNGVVVGSGDVLDSGSKVWPFDVQPNVDIPDWATHAFIVVTVNSVYHDQGNVSGSLAPEILIDGTTTYTGTSVGYTLNSAVGTVERVTLAASAEMYLGPNLRGTTQKFRVRGARTTGPGYISTAPGSQVIYDIQFYERAI